MMEDDKENARGRGNKVRDQLMSEGMEDDEEEKEEEEGEEEKEENQGRDPECHCWLMGRSGSKQGAG